MDINASLFANTKLQSKLKVYFFQASRKRSTNINFTHSFHNARVLITGHTGFKGVWLSFLLKRSQARLFGLSLPPRLQENRLFLETNASSLFDEEYFIDIANGDAVREVISRCKPEYVFHLAAQSLVPEAKSNPESTVATNVLGTVNVAINSFRSKTVKRLLVASTDKVYKSIRLPLAFSESDQLEGNEVYSASKVASEQLLQVIANQYRSANKLTTVVRAGNVVGGGDYSSSRLVPGIIEAFRNKEVFQVRKLYATRPYQHILDCLEGYLRAINQDIASENTRSYSCYNFGPENSISTREVLDIFSSFKEVCRDFEFSLSANDGNLFETETLEINSSNARRNLGWIPLFDSRVAVEKAFGWYFDVQNGLNPRDALVSEIESYIHLNSNYGRI